jgi:hypothetical protein
MENDFIITTIPTIDGYYFKEQYKNGNVDSVTLINKCEECVSGYFKSELGNWLTFSGVQKKYEDLHKYLDE